ncbi:MAG: hypothetical protein M0P26_01555 [Bacteroidales bacterium]|nr:hypothetical protein [Bacteroidales bacterium]
MKTYYTILILAGCVIASSLNAQTNIRAQTAKKDTLIQRDLVLEKEYQPTIESTEKILSSPDIETFSMVKQPLDFSITESPTTIVGDYNPLPAAGVKTTFPASEEFGYVRLGIGGHRTFLADAQVNFLRQNKQSLDVNFQNRSVFGDLTNIAGETKRSYFNNNKLLASYKLHLTNTELGADVCEKYNAWNYYGTWRTFSLPGNALSIPSSQWSSDTKIGFNIKSKDIGQPFSYIIHAESHLFRLGKGVTSETIPTDEKGGREKEFSINAALNYDLNMLFHLGLDAKMRNFTYRAPVSWPADETVSYDENNINNDFEDRRWFEFNPYAKMTYKKWVLTGGLKFAIPSLESERVKANITASASTALGNRAVFHARLDGGVQPQSYREGLEMNPYLDPAIRLKTAWKVLDLSADIEYKPLPGLRVTPMVGYDVTKDAPFFYNGFPDPTEGVNDTYGNLFSVKYMTSNRLKLGMHGLYSFRSLLTVQGELKFNRYLNFSSTNDINDLLKDCGRKAWYKPGFEIRLRADISPVEKLNLFLDYQLEAQRYAADKNHFCKKLGNINDLNIGANYKLTKDVGIFLHLNNMLDQRYEVWNTYAVHGFTAVVGGSVMF